MRLVLVDDEALAVERLQHLLAELPAVKVVGVARDGDEAVTTIRALRPDAVLLDIQMPGRSGIAVAEALEAAGRTDVIFVSAFDHYAARAFDIEATDYLLKPVSSARLAQALARVRRRRAGEAGAAPAAAAEAAETRFIWVPGRTGMLRLATSAIIWVEAAGDYVLLHTLTRTHMLRATMGEITGRLTPDGMVRAHRSALVRPSAVTELSRTAKGNLSLVMGDGASVPVGPSYRTEVLAAIGVAGDEDRSSELAR